MIDELVKAVILIVIYGGTLVAIFGGLIWLLFNLPDNPVE